MEEQKDMTYKETMEYVEGLKKYGVVPGLASIRDLCEKLGDPQRSLRFVHIAGTNGKGSVLAFLSEILKAAGYRTGRFSSPALFEYREAIQVNGRSVSPKALSRHMTRIRKACEELMGEGKPHPTAFEVETALAFCYFREKGCQLVVLETGLGGLLDATNIVESTLVCVFTSISLDHMGVLGNSLQEIAENKAGILKPGAVAVALKGDQETAGVLAKKAQEMSVPLVWVEPSRISGIRRGLEKQTFSYGRYKNISIALSGLWQVENGALAVETACQLSKMGVSIPDEAIYKGLIETRWPGRFQVLSKRPYIIADGAHNRDGAKRLAQSISFYFTNRRILYIIGMLRDKEQDEVLKETCALAEQVLTVPTKGDRGLSAYELACMAGNWHGQVTAADSIEEALELALLLADKDTVIVAFGSLSYLGDLIRLVERQKSANRIK